MSHVFHRRIAEELPIAARGEGIYLIDTEGKIVGKGHSSREFDAPIKKLIAALDKDGE